MLVGLIEWAYSSDGLVVISILHVFPFSESKEETTLSEKFSVIPSSPSNNASVVH